MWYKKPKLQVVSVVSRQWTSSSGTCALCDTRFAQQFCWWYMSSGMWCCVAGLCVLTFQRNGIASGNTNPSTCHHFLKCLNCTCAFFRWGTIYIKWEHNGQNNGYCRSEHHRAVDDDVLHDFVIRVHCVVSAQKSCSSCLLINSEFWPLCSVNSDTILQKINRRGNVLRARQG